MVDRVRPGRPLEPALEGTMTGSGQSDAIVGREADLWYCPWCGYIDPKTTGIRCPREHPGGRHPMFRQAVYGYFIRIGLEERPE
jgi:hypothetical protein